MPASLTATVNPAGVFGETATGSTTINWSTDNGPRARLYILIKTPTSFPLSEDLFDGDPASGDRSGSKVLPVAFGNTYSLILRQASDNAILATLVVTVYDIIQRLAEQAAASAALLEQLNPSQAIHNLRIRAGIDSVRITFNTVQPTIPLTRVLRMDGTEVDAAFPLFGGLQTAHEAVLGQVTPLDQGTEFQVSIMAAGHNSHNKQHDVVATSQFTTGSRYVQVEFDTIKVLQDGDPGIKGAGEFTFSFGAGDAEQGTDLGEPWPAEYEADISDDDGPVFVLRQIRIPMAPRSLWVQVIGTEDDATFFSGAAYNLGRRPHFFGAGTDGYENANESQTQVTGVFDLSDATYGTTLPIELETGNFGVAFHVSGSIYVQTTPGISPVFFPRFATVKSISKAALLAGIGATGRLPGGKMIARGADGAVYHRVPDAKSKMRRDGGWLLAAPVTEGPVTAVATAPDRMALFALDAEGAMLRAEVIGGHTAQWENLGGRFTGRVTAVALSASVELLAADKTGALHHLSLPAEDGNPTSDWRRICDGVQGEIRTLALGKDALAVFALGRRGEVMHTTLRDGRWDESGWQVIPGATGERLGLAYIEGEALALAVIGADMQFQTLLWRGYPGKKPARWVAEGDFQAWLVRTREVEPAPQPTLSKRAAE